MGWLGRLLFKLVGWKAEGEIPPEIKKCIIVAAPHTSNWDFFYALFAFYILDFKAKYLIKSNWMVFPLNIFFKLTGAIGVERKVKGNGLVDGIVKKIEKMERVSIVIAPEGTRKTVTRWKTGFYNLALKAELPLVLAYLDYDKKTAGVGLVIHPTGDYYKDMLQIQNFYKNITPKHPETYTVDILQGLEVTKKTIPEL
ncbi:MAG TPA: 1-acyl-sn-glycerol-3-phosphate acyltransferase [Syntrophomonadaceae bacterium]|nr:1-acyl-sn-glycerol-3-phosphate acyltransferase [Syntrophomonadaceae bacterium]